MQQVWFTGALWLFLALVAVLAANWLRIATALSEIVVGTLAQLVIGAPAGATVLVGLEGYGETAAMHRAHFARSDRPVIVTIVDTEENLARLVPAVEEMTDTGLMAASEVRMIRVEKKATTHDGTGA
jgi:PII-like signaling protein